MGYNMNINSMQRHYPCAMHYNTHMEAHNAPAMQPLYSLLFLLNKRLEKQLFMCQVHFGLSEIPDNAGIYAGNHPYDIIHIYGIEKVLDMNAIFMFLR